jgi:ketosteroid isomerase-like protein
VAQAHPNAVVARRLWDALCDGDVSQLEALLTPDVVWRSAGRNPLSGEVKGVDASLEWIARSAESVEDLRSALIDVFANDRGAILWIRTHAERGPVVLDVDFLLLLQIADGCIYEASAIPMDQRRNDEFWRLQ